MIVCIWIDFLISRSVFLVLWASSRCECLSSLFWVFLPTWANWKYLKKKKAQIKYFLLGLISFVVIVGMTVHETSSSYVYYAENLKFWSSLRNSSEYQGVWYTPMKNLGLLRETLTPAAIVSPLSIYIFHVSLIPFYISVCVCV